MKSNLHIEYYISVIIIWIILFLGIFYAYLHLSSTFFWNQKIEKLYETFVGSASSNSGNSFVCTFKQINNGLSFGCEMPAKSSI